jgi:hypothetical protein
VQKIFNTVASSLASVIRNTSIIPTSSAAVELAFSMLAVEQPLDIGTADIVRKKSLSRNWMLNWM